MMHVLVPVNDRSDAECAAKHVIDRYLGQPVVLYLVNVQLPISKFVSRCVNHKQLEEFQKESGMEVLQPLIDKLDAAGISHQQKILVGYKAEAIAQFARQHYCDQIMVPKKRNSVFESLGLASISSQLRHLMGAKWQCDISELY